MSDPAPGFTLTILDGQVGSADAVPGDNVAILACSSAGVEGAPGAMWLQANQLAELKAGFGVGPGPQLAARLLNKGRACGLVKAHATTPGSAGAVTKTAPGGSTATMAVSTGTAFDYYPNVIVRVEKSGTVGTAGVLISWSLDGGNTDFESPVPLPTSGILPITDSGLVVTFSASAATLVAGDTFSFSTTAPKWNSSDITAAMDVLRSVSFQWDWIYIVGACSAAEATAIGAKLDAWKAQGVYTGAMVETKQQTTQSDSAWQSDLISDYATVTSTRVLAAAGDDRLFSPMDQSEYLRPAGWPLCERAALRDPTLYEIGRVKLDAENTGALDCNLFGPVTAVNTPAPPIGHNEAANSGLDNPQTMLALGFATLTTLQTKGDGVYCTRARMLSPKASDYTTWRLRRIMDVACTATQSVLMDELQETPPLNPADGTLDASYAEALKTTCENAVREALKGAISGVRVVVDRTNNVPKTKKVNVKISILPNGDIEQINETIGYVVSLADNTTTSEAA